MGCTFSLLRSMHPSSIIILRDHHSREGVALAPQSANVAYSKWRRTCPRVTRHVPKELPNADPELPPSSRRTAPASRSAQPVDASQRGVRGLVTVATACNLLPPRVVADRTFAIYAPGRAIGRRRCSQPGRSAPGCGRDGHVAHGPYLKDTPFRTMGRSASSQEQSPPRPVIGRAADGVHARGEGDWPA